MTKREQFKRLRDSGSTLSLIATLMVVNIKTCKRWNKEYKNGTLIREHGLTNKPGNRGSTIDKDKILKDYLNSIKKVTADRNGVPYNFSYYVEKKLNGSVSLSTFKNIMSDNLLASPWANKKTKRAYNKILKDRMKTVSNIKTKQLISEVINLNKKVFFRKPRPLYAGEIGEVDACKDYWLGDLQSHLHAMYDPATKRIIALHLEKEETTHGYYKILEQSINTGQTPALLKGDCRSTFVINKKDAGALAHKDVNTQFGFVLNMLSVKMENSSEPTFKGGVERLFRTLQNHLKGEFRERGIITFEKANEYLQEYMDWYNQRYSIEPIKKESKFVKLKINKEEVNNLLSIRAFRKTDKANSISYKSELYSLYKKGARVSFKEKSAILVFETLDKKLKASYFGEELELRKTSFEFLTTSQKEQYSNMKRMNPNFSAPDHHPWGYRVFLLHLNATNNLNRYLLK